MKKEGGLKKDREKGGRVEEGVGRRRESCRRNGKKEGWLKTKWEY